MRTTTAVGWLTLATTTAFACAGGELDLAATTKAGPAKTSATGVGGFAGGTQRGLPPEAKTPASWPKIRATVGSTRFVTREHFLASAEMQITGEPFAELLGRDLSAYSRDHVPADLYFDTSPSSQGPFLDLVGFSTAVESYEYSKQPMNGAAFELGSGTSLVHGALVDTAGLGGKAALVAAAARVQHFGASSNSQGRFVFPPGTYPKDNASGNQNPEGLGDPKQNPLGWPGMWPTLHLFRSFDPAIHPVGTTALLCALTSDDDPGATGALVCADYECDASSLRLVDRAGQIESVVTPGADGFSAWKYGLWVLNYLQSMHDSTNTAVAAVDPNDLAKVGVPGNDVVGTDDDGAPTAPGTYLGSSDVEGFQAQLFVEMMDGRAEDWLLRLSTSDGVTLSGFATLGDALAYDHAAPLRWFPSVAVTEAKDDSGFPRPAYALASPDSEVLDLVGLVLGYSQFYALTDVDNADVGGSLPALAFFDGDPFPGEEQRKAGQPTLHDRALAMLRVSLTNLDRLHVDPKSGVLVDLVSMKGGVPSRGSVTSTVNVAYSMLALRAAVRTLSSQLELYSNNTPDTGASVTPLDASPFHVAGGGTEAFGPHFRALLQREADLLLDKLTDASGLAHDGWDVTAGAAVGAGDSLDAHAAAVRGLFAGYLATGDTRYRQRALAVAARMHARFWDAAAGLYGSTPAPVASVEMTPLRFALVQSALRDEIELWASRPGNEASLADLTFRMARLNKLVLNGWNDVNANRTVDWPDECVNVVDGLPRGGLQMAERTLSGEIGVFEEKLSPGQTRTPTSDREHDCVPEIDDARLPSALAASVTFTVMK